MRTWILSNPHLVFQLEIDRKLGGILKHAIAGAMPSEERFDEIWRSIVEQIQNPCGAKQGEVQGILFV